MTSRHRVGLALLTLAAVPALSVSVVAQTVEDAPTNCCTETYWAGWELGRLRSISAYAAPGYEQAAGVHMQRLAASLQAANESCCHFCEAWAEWPQIRDGIRAEESELLASPQRDPAEKRRVFAEWLASRPDDLIEGLNRCNLEEGAPCKWLGLVDCARAYFRLGVQLGQAMHALSAASDSAEARPAPARSARQEGLESLETAAGLLASLRTGDGALGPGGARMRCDYLWEAETGIESLLAEAGRQPDRHSNAHLADVAARANRLVLDLLVHGRPELGIAPCPIGDAHDHEECDRRMEVGP